MNEKFYRTCIVIYADNEKICNYSAFSFIATGIQPIIPKGHPLTHVPAGRADVRPTKYKFTCGEGAGFSLHHTFLRTLQQVQSPMAE